jgi:hypothetical protein
VIISDVEYIKNASRYFLLALALALGCAACTQSCALGLIDASVASPSPEPADNGFLLTAFGAPIRWEQSQLPIMIWVHTDAVLWYYHAKKAASIWNRALGMEIFLVEDEPREDAAIWAENSPGVVPILETDKDDPYTSYSAINITGALTAAPIYMPTRLELALMPDSYLFLVHEMGHALGLAHDQPSSDGRPWSIMEPVLRLPTENPPPITEHDLRLLRDWYSQKPQTQTSTESTPPIPR